MDTFFIGYIFSARVNFLFDKHSKLFDALPCSIEITNTMKYHYILILYYVIWVDIYHGIFLDIKETITTQCHLSIP